MATATITVPWTISNGTASYTLNLYQCTDSSCTAFTNSNQPIQSLTITGSQNGSFSRTFTVTGLASGVTYYFKAAFVNVCSGGGGAETNIISANCPATSSTSSPPTTSSTTSSPTCSITANSASATCA